MPDARVWVRNGEEIAFVLKTANELGVCVSVRGSGTGCAGGCVPVDGGIVLDLSKINFIEIYPRREGGPRWGGRGDGGHRRARGGVWAHVRARSVIA